MLLFRIVLTTAAAGASLSVGNPLVAQAPRRNSALTSLVAAERAFAKTSVDHGVRAAFLENLADDAVIFRPGPVAGRPWFEQSSPTDVYLNWAPAFADVATSGELGFTTGPYELRPGGKSDSTVRRFGHFVTVWKRASHGPWRVALDLGIAHPTSATESLAYAEAHARIPAGGADARAGMLGADSSLGMDRVTAGQALLARLAQGARVYRDGQLPATTPDAIRALLANERRTLRSVPLDGHAASSKDFGYSYGTYTLSGASPNAEEHGYYLRIWRRDAAGAWKLALDLLSPSR